MSSASHFDENRIWSAVATPASSVHPATWKSRVVTTPILASAGSTVETLGSRSPDSDACRAIAAARSRGEVPCSCEGSRVGFSGARPETVAGPAQDPASRTAISAVVSRAGRCMDLFYHASRDIELPRSTRRSAADRSARACEACGHELEPGEPSEGGTLGLAFCADCRARLDRSAIQIHFCDGCGESVPIHAVEEGTAITGDGRILCVECRARSRAPGIRPGIVVAAVLALALGVALALFLR